MFLEERQRDCFAFRAGYATTFHSVLTANAVNGLLSKFALLSRHPEFFA